MKGKVGVLFEQKWYLLKCTHDLGWGRKEIFVIALRNKDLLNITLNRGMSSK